MCCFEIKKTLKSKTIVLFPILALILAIFGNFFNTNPITGLRIDQGVSPHTFLDYVVIEQPNLSFEFDVTTHFDKLVGGTPLMQKQYSDLASQLPKENYWNMNPYNTTVPVLSSQFSKDLLVFIESNNFEINETLKQDIIYSEKAYSFLEKNNIDINRFLNEERLSFQDILLVNSDLYFGFLPLALILIVTAYSISREYEKGSIVFEATLPVNRKYIAINKVIAGLFLILIYILSLFLCSVIFGLFRGNLDFYVFYPMKIFTMSGRTTTLLMFFIKMISIFISKSLLFISLGLLIGVIFKKTSMVQIIVAFSLALAWIVTIHLKLLPSMFNPVFSSYSDWLIGSRFVNTTIMTGYIYEYVHPSFNWVVVIVFILLSSLFLLISFCVLQPDQKVNIDSKSKIVSKDLTLFGWENYKQNRYLNYAVIGSLFIVLLLTIGFPKLRTDKFSFDDRILNTIERQMVLAQIDTIEVNIQMNEDRLKEDISQKDKDYATSMLELYNNELVNAQAKLENMDILSKVYYSGDSKEFYGNLNETYQLKQNDEYNLHINSGAPESYDINPNTLLNGEVSEFSNQASDAFREYLLGANIKPMPILFERSLTYYDKTIDINDLNKAMKAQLPSDSSSFVLLYRVLETNFLGVILVITSVFIFGANYYLDFETGHQLDYLYTQPIKKTRLYDKKYLMGLVNVLKMVVFGLLIVLLLGLLLNPSRTLNFPILKYIGFVEDPMQQIDFSNFFTYIPLIVYLLQSCGLIVLCAIFLFSLVQLLSIKIRNRIMIYTITIGIFGLLFLLLTIFPQSAGLNPISYFYISDVVTGSLAVRYGFLGVSFIQGIIILLAYSALFYIFGRLYSKQ